MRGEHARLRRSGPATLQELAQAFLAVDHYPHRMDFVSETELINIAKKAGFKVVLSQVQSMRKSYDNITSLTKSLKAIGAANKHPARRRGLFTPRQWQHVEQALPRTKAGDIMITWEVHYLLLEAI